MFSSGCHQQNAARTGQEAADQAALTKPRSSEMRSRSPLSSSSSPREKAPAAIKEQQTPKSRVFTAHEVEKRMDFFIAGRGGITNLHVGNKAFRERVVEHAEKYNELRTCERGKRFARNLLDRCFADITFVVAHSYFFKNLATISKEKIKSVETEHGGSLDDLKVLPADHYFTVGETWILGIISDIVRFEAAKQKGQTKKSSLTKHPSPATVSDDECTCTISHHEESPVKKRLRKTTKGLQVDRRVPFALSGSEIALVRTEKEIKASVAKRATPCGAEDLFDQLNELDSLIKSPILSVEDDACMFGHGLRDDETLLEVLRELGS
eukprot:scaffold18507_cov188-Amphora_coffeaeformis.AAC.6